MFSYMRPVMALFAAVTALLMTAGAVCAAQPERTGAPSSAAARTGNSGGFVMAQAHGRLVCCYKRQPGGALLFSLSSARRCRSSGGREVGMVRCRRPDGRQVCCATRRGFLTMSRGQCGRAGREANPARCSEFRGRRVCCATPNGLRTMSREACLVARGHMTLAVRCSPRALICCQATDPDGTISYRLVTARACENARGRVAKGRFCRNALSHRRRHRRY